MPSKGPSKHGNPRVRTIDILLWLREHLAEADESTFTAKEVAEKFNLSAGDVQRRLLYLKTWGLVRKAGVVETGKRGRQAIQYAVTDWGMDYDPDYSKNV